MRDHAHGLGIDLRRLRAAYDRMPVLTDERRKIASALVEVATAAIGPHPDPAAIDLSNPLPARDDSRGIQGRRADGEGPLHRACPISETERRLPRRVADRANQGNGRTRPDRPFTVKNIAAVARITPNHFSTIFSKATGVPFTTFLLDQRVALAKQWLRDLTLHVNEVGKRAGFPDGGYFTRRFRKATGMTPTQWRSSI